MVTNEASRRVAMHQNLPLTRPVGTRKNSSVFYFYNFKRKEGGYKLHGKWREGRLYRRT
jgi:hypothetical protein